MIVDRCPRCPSWKPHCTMACCSIQRTHTAIQEPFCSRIISCISCGGADAFNSSSFCSWCMHGNSLLRHPQVQHSNLQSSTAAAVHAQNKTLAAQLHMPVDSFRISKILDCHLQPMHVLHCPENQHSLACCCSAMCSYVPCVAAQR